VYFQHTTYLFDIPGSAFAALTAAGLTTSLPLAGQCYPDEPVDAFVVEGKIRSIAHFMVNNGND
jgi:hypothetical protein